MASDTDYLAMLQAANSTDEVKAEDKPIWVKGSKKGSPGNQWQTPTQMQKDLLAQAAERSSSYNKTVNGLYNAGFISKAQRDQPTSVAAALAFPTSMYSAYADRVGDSAVSFNKWFDWYVSTSDSPSESGGGGYSGPTTTKSVTLTDKADVKSSLNSFAIEMLGRNLTDRELKKYSKEYRSEEKNSPQITTNTPGGLGKSSSVTKQTKSRDEIARDILQDNPAFSDNVIKTDVLDMFFNRLGGKSNG